MYKTVYQYYGFMSITQCLHYTCSHLGFVSGLCVLLCGKVVGVLMETALGQLFKQSDPSLCLSLGLCIKVVKYLIKQINFIHVHVILITQNAAKSALVDSLCMLLDHLPFSFFGTVILSTSSSVSDTL